MKTHRPMPSLADFRHLRVRCAIAVALFALLSTLGRTAYADTQFSVVAPFDTTTQTPVAQLTQATDGYLYGTSLAGGAAGAGSIFQLTPAGTVTLIYAFSGGADGAYPYAGLVQGAD